jgi:hypothetical protein
MVVADTTAAVIKDVSSIPFFFYRFGANQFMQNNHISIIQAIGFACCDSVALCILVRSTDDAFQVIYLKIFKDIPLLDCVGLQ